MPMQKKCSTIDRGIYDAWVLELYEQGVSTPTLKNVLSSIRAELRRITLVIATLEALPTGNQHRRGRPRKVLDIATFLDKKES